MNPEFQAALLRALITQGLPVTSLAPARADLQQLYLDTLQTRGASYES